MLDGVTAATDRESKGVRAEAAVATGKEEVEPLRPTGSRSQRKQSVQLTVSIQVGQQFCWQGEHRSLLPVLCG